MQFSEIGQIADEFWREIPQHFPNVQLDEFVVMPNHVHGIIQIVTHGRDAINRVSTENSKIKNVSLSTIIRWYKGRSTFEIRKSVFSHFAWQPRFHDHIIRDDEPLDKIRLYIQQNPTNWEIDELFQPQVPVVRASDSLPKSQRI
ncbi:MAG: transposase [Spirochaetes bacterium]|nr:transposase [Spirochaetota bacterium]